MIYLTSFLFCGFICMIGQIIYDNTKWTFGHITTLFVYQRKEVDLHDLSVEHSDLCEIGGFWPLERC